MRPAHRAALYLGCVQTTLKSATHFQISTASGSSDWRRTSHGLRSEPQTVLDSVNRFWTR